MTPELHIEPLVHFTDLILAIGLIGLGLSILAVVITVEIYYFRKGGGQHGKALQKTEKPNAHKRPYVGNACGGDWYRR